MSKFRIGYSKISRLESMEDPFKKYTGRRQPIKGCEPMCAYCDLETSVVIQFLREDFGGVTSIRYGEDKIAVGYNFGHLQVFKDKGRDLPLTVLRGWEGHDSITCVRFHPQVGNMLYASSTEGVVYRCNLGEDILKPEEFTTEEKNEINSFDFDVSGRKLITGGKDASIRMYDVGTNSLMIEYSKRSELLSEGSDASLSAISNEIHDKRLYCVKFHPENSHIFLSGGWDGIVKIWDTRVASAFCRNIYGPYIFGEAIDISNGNVVTGSCVAKNSLELWDFGSGNLIQDILPTNRRVSLFGDYTYTTQFYRGDPGGDLVLAGGAGLGGLQLISVKEAKIVYLFEDERPVVAVDSANGKITFGGKSNTLISAQVYTSDVTEEETYLASTTASSKSTISTGPQV